MSTDPAGWRPDPTGEHLYRYWDGDQWTDRVTDDAVASTTRDPVATDTGTSGPSWPEAGPAALPSGVDRGAAEASLPKAGPGTLLGADGGLTTDGMSSPQPLPAGAGGQSGRIVKKGPSARLLAAMAAGAAAVTAAVVVLVVSSDGGAADDDSERADKDDEATAEVPADEANDELRDIMQTAGRQLEDAGAFAFEAEIVVPSSVDLGDSDRVEVEGEVSLPDSMRQRGGSTRFFDIGDEERVVVGDRAWRRTSAFPDALDEIPWIPEDQLLDGTLLGGTIPDVVAAFPDPLAATRIPQWLTGAIDHEDGGTDEGHRVVTARVSDESVPRPGSGPPPILRDATVDLTVDHSGLPLRVVLSARLGGSTVSASYDLADIGDPVTIEVPGPDEIDPLPTVDQHDIAAVAEDGIVPVGLTSLPVGWQLMHADAIVQQDAVLRCPASVTVTYRAPTTGWLWILATQPTSECAVGPVDGPRFTAGDHVGTLREPSEDERGTTVDVGFGSVMVEDLTVVEFDIADQAVSVIAFHVPELADVLDSLGPIDPSQQAEPISPQVPQPPPPGQSGRQPG